MSQFKTITPTLAPGVFQTVAARDVSRRFLQIQNKGDSSVFINFGSTVPDETNSLEITSGGFYEPYRCPTNELIMSASASASGDIPVLIITDEITTTTVRT